MTERVEIERLLHELYTARVRGQLDALCACFTTDATFQIAGASNAAPLAMTAQGIGKYRPLLAIMLRTFKLHDRRTLCMLIDGSRAAVHWHANVHSRITGNAVPTELVDVIETRDGRIASYVEFFTPR